MIFCIDIFADEFSISFKESFDILHNNDVLVFLKDCYEVEHTLGKDMLIWDMEDYLINQGYAGLGIKERHTRNFFGGMH